MGSALAGLTIPSGRARSASTRNHTPAATAIQTARPVNLVQEASYLIGIMAGEIVDNERSRLNAEELLKSRRNWVKEKMKITDSVLDGLIQRRRRHDSARDVYLSLEGFFSAQ